MNVHSRNAKVVRYNQLAVLTLLLTFGLLVYGSGCLPIIGSREAPTATPAVAYFATATPAQVIVTIAATDPIPTQTSMPTETPTLEPTFTPPVTPSPVDTPISTGSDQATVEAAGEPSLATPSPVLPEATPPAEATPIPEPPSPTPGIDFVVRLVRMRTNAENSWDGTLGNCGSDHSIYVHVADAQEKLLDGILIGDKYGNFEVPTGPDGPGTARILVWSATMELTVLGGQDGARYTSQFTPPLSTLDEQIPLDWLQAAGYCNSPEDCQQRVETNQLCRGHYSYDVVFQRTW
jgi:hypothetical protein